MSGLALAAALERTLQARPAIDPGAGGTGTT